MNFFISKNSTLPALKYPLTQHIMDKYDITDDMMDNCAVTFSMIDKETGVYRIANVAARLAVREDRPTFPDETKYTLVFNFSTKHTSKAGQFLGEFKVDFLGENCGKITFPTGGEQINIFIQDSITKTTVI